MEDGSRPIGEEDSRILVPNLPEDMVPKQDRVMGESDDPRDSFVNLVKQSIPGFDSYGLDLEVSNDKTSDKSGPNARPLDGKYWSKPYLTDVDFSNDEAPNWIYVAADGKTRAGASTGDQKADSPDRIIGRYAFNVYNVSGLLDINVAGFDPSGEDLAERKGSLVFADVEYLADQVGVNLGGALDTLNDWRYSTNLKWTQNGGQPDESLALLLKTGPLFASLGKYPPGVPNGIDSVIPDGRLHQNVFLSRADTIKFFEKEMGEEDAHRLLPFLTHFSRGINKPSTVWDWETSTRPLPKLTLFGNPFKSPDKLDNASVVREINADVWDESGKPRLARRFPLEKLSLLQLGSNGEPVGDPTEIERYFGLRWTKAGEWPHWEYVPRTGDQNKPLRKLADISPEDAVDPDRQPTFFEILAAAIYSGSLGQQLGGVAGTDSSEWRGRPHGYGKDDARVDLHVMRIGAAIIDQWDSDSWPTEIEFGKQSVFGVEDLPYLHGFRRNSYFGTKNYQLDGNAVTECRMLIHPQVWNPHSKQSGRGGPGAPARPTQFRVIPYTKTLHGNTESAGQVGNPLTAGKFFGWGSDFGRDPRFWPYDNASANGSYRYAEWIPQSAETGPTTVSPLNWDQFNGPLNQATDWMQFTDTRDQTREPVLLWKSTVQNPLLDDEQPIAVTLSGAGQTAEAFQVRPDTARNVDPNYNQASSLSFLGFKVGQFLALSNFNSVGARGLNQVVLVQYLENQANSVRANFALQYLGPHGWQTYDIMYDTVDFDNNAAWGYDKKVWRVVGWEFDACYRVDPRVERFGPQSQWFRVDNPSKVKHIVKFPPHSTGWADAEGRIATRQPNNDNAWNFYSVAGGGDYGYKAYNHIPHLGSNPAGQKNPNSGYWSYTSPNAVESRGLLFGDITENAPGGPTSAARPRTVYYKDPDMEERWASVPSYQTFTANTDTNPAYPGNDLARPIVLNRPFQSVAEMGYACRDLPWKSLDFWNANSGDSALLDYFCLYETDPDLEGDQLTAGVVNINMVRPEVLASIIRGTGRSAGTGSPTDSNWDPVRDEAPEIADVIVEWTRSKDSQKGPFRSRGEIVGKWADGAYVGPIHSESESPIADILGADGLYGVRRTSVLRSLVDTSDVRTWNLMIDVVAQSGRIPPGEGTDRFVVEGQTRYWVFVALDRFTGKVVDQRIEVAE